LKNSSESSPRASAVRDIIYLEKKCRSLGILLLVWDGKLRASANIEKHPYVFMAVVAHREGLIKWLQIVAS
jgi:hypothetical protein